MTDYNSKEKRILANALIASDYYTVVIITEEEKELYINQGYTIHEDNGKFFINKPYEFDNGDLERIALLNMDKRINSIIKYLIFITILLIIPYILLIINLSRVNIIY